MRVKIIVLLASAGILTLASALQAQVRRSGGFSGRGGSVRYGGIVDPGSAAWSINAYQYGAWDGYDPVYGTIGRGGYTQRPANYGSVHYCDTGRSVPGEYRGSGQPAQRPDYGATYRGSMDRTVVLPSSHLDAGELPRGSVGSGAAPVRGSVARAPVGYVAPVGAVPFLPNGSGEVSWEGTTYYRSGCTFYRPLMYAGTLVYQQVTPPTGWFFDALPTGALTYTAKGATYSYSNGVYYQTATQDGKQGYVVVAPPAQPGTTQGLPSAKPAEPDPSQLLKRMSDCLGRQKYIMMKVNEEFDEVTPAGQKIQLSDQRMFQAERPDKMAVEIRGAHAQRRVVYDGAAFTMIDLIKGVYASVPMTGSLESVMDQLATKYGLAQPLGELLYADLHGRIADKIKAGQYLGKTTVADHTCHHLVFLVGEVSWQIWIEDGDRPVPWKLVMTYRTAPGRPQFTAELSDWSFSAPASGEPFKVIPPRDAKKVEMAELFGPGPSE